MVLVPHLLDILHVYINFVMKHQFDRGNMDHRYIDAKAKEVLLRTGHEGNEICHNPKVRKYIKTIVKTAFTNFHL